jgi:hypothetical protein
MIAYSISWVHVQRDFRNAQRWIFILWSSGLWHRIIWYVVASESEEQNVLSPERQITQRLIPKAQHLNFHNPENFRPYKVIHAICNNLWREDPTARAYRHISLLVNAFEFIIYLIIMEKISPYSATHYVFSGSRFSWWWIWREYYAV